MTDDNRVHLHRILAVIGGIFVYWAIGNLVAKQFPDHPLFALSIATMSSVILFGWVALKGIAFRGPIETPIPFIVLALPLCLLLILNWWANPFDLTDLGLHHTRQVLILSIFCLLVGLGEELLFRGYVFSLCNQWNTPFALLFSSIVFGLLHFDRGWYGTVFAIAGGFGFGLARIAGIPLGILVLLHAATNFPTKLSDLQPYYWVQFLAILVIGYTVLVTIAYLAIPRQSSNKSAMVR